MLPGPAQTILSAIRPARWMALTSAAAAAALVAGCGGAGANGGTNTTGRRAGISPGQGIRFAQCMRSHGVPNFPDPSGNGFKIQITPGSGVNPQSPSFQHAQSACRHLLPGGGPPAGSSAQAKQRLLTIALCMRKHGLTTFPDPTTSAPSPGSLPRGSMALGQNGAFLVIPPSIATGSPAFRQAAAACHFPLPPAH